MKKEKNRSTRLLLLVTHGCCLKCKYCFVPQDSRKHMTRDTLLRSIDFLMSSSARNIQLHYFGGEPLMVPFPLLKESIRRAKKLAAKKGKKLDILITTNGVLLTKERIEFLKKAGAILEISIDGDAKAQNFNRPQKTGFPNSYHLILRNLPLIFESGIDCRASMVVAPETVGKLLKNFEHLVGLGFKNIFIMMACGVNWPVKARKELAKNLKALEARYLEMLWNGRMVNLLNLTEWLSPFRMNTELSVDFDGSIYSACISYLVHDEKRKKKFVLGHIGQRNETMDEFERRRLSNERAMEVIYRENGVFKYLDSNIETGKIMVAFVGSLKKKIARGLKNL